MAEWRWLGDRAIRFTRPPVPAQAIVRAVKAWPGVIDCVVAAHDVAAYFAGEPIVDPDRIAALATLATESAPARELELRARYDGADLDDVARATKLSVAEVVARHAAAAYTVESIGFAPGFAYLTGLPAELELPRRATPRPRVPAGSLAIALRFTAVYPFDSPGGWHLIGRVVDGPMFGASGARLRLGDRVRFVEDR